MMQRLKSLGVIGTTIAFVLVINELAGAIVTKFYICLMIGVYKQNVNFILTPTASMTVIE